MNAAYAEIKLYAVRDRIEVARVAVDALVLELYKLIDATPEDATVDPDLAVAYQSLNIASIACANARQKVTIAAENAL